MEAVSFAEVLARPDVWRGGRCADGALPVAASGFAELDAELPGGGWPRGALTELLCDGVGLGEVSLLLPALAGLCADDGWLLLIAPPHPLQASAWHAAGVPLQRLVVVTPTGKGAARDALWAAAQGLASDAPAAILCWSREADARALRRLQVAAAAGRSALFLFRPLAVAGQSSPAPLRLHLAGGEAGRLAVRMLKRRGPPLARTLFLAMPRPALWRGTVPTITAPVDGVHDGSPLARSLPAAPVPGRLPEPFVA